MQKNNSPLASIVDGFKGDKVIWMIALMLILISLLVISSSTSLLAIKRSYSRVDIVGNHLKTAAAGLIVILFFVFCIRKIAILRFCSRFGYLLSLALLLFLVMEMKLGKLVYVSTEQRAIRAITIAGREFHVYEFVKVFMIMYLAWAFDMLKRLRKGAAAPLVEKLRFMGLQLHNTDFWNKFFYIFFPILSVSVLILAGSFSSFAFIGGVMLLLTLVAGIKLKEFIPYALMGVVVLLLCFGAYKASGGKVFERFATVESRMEVFLGDHEHKAAESKSGTREYDKQIGRTQQSKSAKLAVKEGGFLGKGPGRSTQRYKVKAIYEDFMFCFILEEYGFAGGLLVLIIYGSLLARGVIVIRNCNKVFSRLAVAGLVLLISSQAIMHIMVNVGLLPVTGQTLPLLSLGNSSFLAFSLAFGILLSISRIAKDNVEKEQAAAQPLSTEITLKDE